MIKSVYAREIIDSRGNPTVEVLLLTKEGEFISSVPSGASAGTHEAKELRDGEERYGGKGVLQAVYNINTKIKKAIEGREADIEEVDRLLLELDGTQNKSVLGANAILGVSMSVARAAAAKAEVSLFDYISSRYSFVAGIPSPCFNVINGGAHAGSGTDLQEFMIVPQENNFAENLRKGVEKYHGLKKNLSQNYGEKAINIGDEGGFVPTIKSSEEVLQVLKDLDDNLPVLIDAAATEFYKNGNYHFEGEERTTEEMIDFYEKIAASFNLLGIEDPLEENDFNGWSHLQSKLSKLLIVGDDLLTTNAERMKEAQQKGSCNAMILKINQIGSISEAIKAAKLAREYGWKIIVSHRSGETNDDFIADFAVGIGAEYIKSGAPARGERVAKYNKLLRIEESLN